MGKLTNRTRSGPMGQNLPDLESSSSTSPYPYPVEIECKEMARLSLKQRHMDQARENARGNAWALALKEKMTGRKLVVMDAEEWATLLLRAESASSTPIESGSSDG